MTAITKTTMSPQEWAEAFTQANDQGLFAAESVVGLGASVAG